MRPLLRTDYSVVRARYPAAPIPLVRLIFRAQALPAGDRPALNAPALASGSDDDHQRCVRRL